MVVLDESKFKDKLNILLEFGVYEHSPKDHTAKIWEESRETPL
jgi:hypothetical protein